MKAVAIDALLTAAVLVTTVSVLGMLQLRNPYQRLNYIASPACLSSFLIAIAVFVARGLKPESFKALFVAFVLVGMNAVVTHATARAFRIAEVPDWHPGEGEEVPILPSDEEVTEA